MKNNDKYIYLIFVLLAIICIFQSCIIKYEKVDQVVKNPTTYCFDFSLEDIMEAITLVFDSASYRNRHLMFNDSPFFVEKDKYFSSPENYNDAVLIDGQIPSNERASFFYYKNNEPLEYYATYQIHVSEISQNKTCLEILTINPEIKIGKFYGFTHDLSFKSDRYISVEPGTVEEYEILYMIGHQLGQLGMPEVQYPDSNAARETRRYFSLEYPVYE